MPGRNKDATIEARQEGGEMMKQYFEDRFDAFIESKPLPLKVKRGGTHEAEESKEEK